MNGFLTFLSNNYLYFLIAAGVLFFALLGFLIDLKKKKDEPTSNNVFEETPIPDIASLDGNQTLNDAINDANTSEVIPNEVDTSSTLQNEIAPSFNPAPPMPNEPDDMAYSSVPNTPQETITNANAVNGETQLNQQVNQNESIEEFK